MHYKTTLLILIALLFGARVGWSQLSTVAISEINSDNQVELINTGTETVDVSSLWLCNFPTYAQVNSLNLVCGTLELAPGAVIVLSGWTVDPADGELGLYLSNSFSSPAAISDYVEWGTSNHQRSSVAVAAGIWTSGTFVPAFLTGQSLLHDGLDNGILNWLAGTPSLCSVNGGCDVEGGTLEGGPFTFCVGDGEADMLEPGSITLTGNSGTNSAWVVTDAEGNILGLPPLPSAVDFDGAGGGACLIWHLSFEDGLMGAEVGMNASDLEGCFDLSNPITVNRLQPEGGTLEGGPFTFCVGDGEADMLEPGSITLSGNSGTNSAWVVTDAEGNILGLPPLPSAVDFDGAGGGACLIWHLSFEDGLMGAEVGMNASDLEGCFDLSNPITVNRLQPEGGTLEGGPFTFCVGDGEADMLEPGSITLSGNSGTNSAWVVTDAAGNILGLPPLPSAVDFDGAGGGACLIWHLSFEDGLMGAEVGMNASDLEGCFDLSNPITVNRLQPEGGTLEGGPFTFCVGDGEADMLEPGSITLSGNSGTNSAWVVTDAEGNILGLPPLPSAVDFDGAGTGACLIWHLSFEDGLMGAEVGMNASDLEGCFDLSNPITVNRVRPEGGTLEGGPFTFTANDGQPDMIPAGSITLTDNNGETNQWVVTDADGVILGLPPMPSVVDFEGAGTGNCLIWHVSYDGELDGLAPGNLLFRTRGCYGVSNPLTVIRTAEGDCQVNGGSLFGGPFAFTVGDGQADRIPDGALTLANSQGGNSQFVVTDANGVILNLPRRLSRVNFDRAGAGDCLIWHLSYEDDLTGLARSANIADLVGCFDLSNSITVSRTSADECQANGGRLFGGPFAFTANDGVADMIPAGSITLANNQGERSQWVVTDADGVILGLPPMPSVVDFEGAGTGNCLIWHVSYDGELDGLVPGNLLFKATGCYGVTNPIAVLRTAEGDCQANGGSLFGGPFDFTVGDGQADRILDGALTLANSQGGNSQFVVTDANGVILNLPRRLSRVNFDRAGAGDCLIWHLSYEDDLAGLTRGANIDELTGCFSLSNSITVSRTSADECQANGGRLFGGPFAFTANDGVADMIPAGSITLANNQGERSQWVVTDADGVILGLPPMPSVVDFEGAGTGNCLIWHVSYDGEVDGLTPGNLLFKATGCYGVTNPIAVIRTAAGDCQVNGGVLFGGPFRFTVGDGQADMIPEGSITLANSQGENSQWVVTDDAGNVLGLPPMPSAVDFDGAGIGNCLIWHLSYDGDPAEQLAMGMNLNDLDLCFDLSNSIVVERTQEANFGLPIEESSGPLAADLRLWPNPVRNVLNLTVALEENPEFVNLEVRSELGQLLLQRELASSAHIREALDLSDLPSGYYLLSLRTARTVVTQPFIKQ